MTIIEAYGALEKAWVEENNVKVGDTVKILRGWEQDELGCELNSFAIMSRLEIGREEKIEFIDGMPQLNKEAVPFFVLEKVKSVEEKRTITLNLTEEQCKELKNQGWLKNE